MLHNYFLIDMNLQSEQTVSCTSLYLRGSPIITFGFSSLPVDVNKCFAIKYSDVLATWFLFENIS